MPNVTITQLPAAGPITGTEAVAIVQNGQTLRTTTGAIAASPAQTQTFLTLNQEPALPNSRALAAGTGLGLTDNGALSTLQINLNGASGSLEGAGNGVVVKTASNTVAARQIATTGTGLGVTNGDGVSGNPTLALTGLAAAVANLGGTGIVAVNNGTTMGGVQILGTTDQIDVTNGNGAGNPTLALASNPVIPGNEAITLPTGTTAQQPVGTQGQIRFNSDTQTFDGFSAGLWRQFATAMGVSAFSAGATGFTPATPTSGAITLSGTLNAAHGGTGWASYTAGDTLYASGATTLSKLAIGSSTYVLTSTGAAPQWSAPSAIAVGTATNLAGGAAGSAPYQTAAGTTTFLSIGAAGQVLQVNSAATAPEWVSSTGTGNVVRATSPTLVTPALGTPTSGTLSSCTGLPISTGVSGLGANVATFLATPSSANLAAAITDETGSGSLVFGTSPTLATPTFTTSATGPLLIGGTTTTSTLILRATSGVGTTGADIILQAGNNGATELMRLQNGGNIGIGTASPAYKLDVSGTANFSGGVAGGTF